MIDDTNVPVQFNSNSLALANTIAQIAAARQISSVKQMTNSNPTLYKTSASIGNGGGSKSIQSMLGGKYYRTRSLSQNLQQIFQGFHYHQQLSQELKAKQQAVSSQTGMAQTPSSASPEKLTTPFFPDPQYQHQPSTSPQKTMSLSPQHAQHVQQLLQQSGQTAGNIIFAQTCHIASPTTPILTQGQHNQGGPLSTVTSSSMSQSMHSLSTETGEESLKNDPILAAMERNPLLASLANSRATSNFTPPLLKSQSFQIGKLKPYSRADQSMSGPSPTRSISFDYSQKANRPPRLQSLVLNPYARSNLMSIENTIRENNDLMRENSPTTHYDSPEYFKRDRFNFDYSVPESRHHYDVGLPTMSSPKTFFNPAKLRYGKHLQEQGSVSLEDVSRTRRLKKKTKKKGTLMRSHYTDLDPLVIGGSCDNLYQLKKRGSRDGHHYFDDNYSTFHGVPKSYGHIPFPGVYRKYKRFDQDDYDRGDDSDISSSYSESECHTSSSSSSLASLSNCKHFPSAHPQKRLDRRNSSKYINSTTGTKGHKSPHNSPHQSRASTPLSSMTPHPLTTSYPPDNGHRRTGSIDTVINTIKSPTSPIIRYKSFTTHSVSSAMSHSPPQLTSVSTNNFWTATVSSPATNSGSFDKILVRNDMTINK